MPGLTGGKGLFEHGRLHAGRGLVTVGVVGRWRPLALRAAYVIGTVARLARQTALDFAPGVRRPR